MPDAAEVVEAADAGASAGDAEAPDVGLVVAVRDSGVGSRDAAVDSGPTDSGLRDSGAAPSDAGQTEADSGVPPIDPLTEGPVLFFSDLITAPRSGNSDDSRGQRAGVDGALVTVWGKGLGAAQADSTITVGGVPARVYYWGPANHGADLVTRMGMSAIELQIPGAAPLGSSPIQVTVGGVASNLLAFTARDVGQIYFVGPRGNDRGDGSFGAPWATFDRALQDMANGDVVYLLDGLVDNSGQNDTGMLGLNTSGTPGLPRAVVAYPGARVVIGGDRCEPTGHGLIANWAPAENGGSNYWVISKLRVESPASCAQDTAISMGAGYRVIGNFISNVRTGEGCQSGSVQCGGLGTCGDDLAILGNEMARTQTANPGSASKQCHGFYISGNRVEDGVERDREIAWNYIHDCGTNRAINIYNESYNGASAPRAQIEGHKIHDNWLENQRGIGVLMGHDVTGDNWIYNNVFINVGLGPEYSDGGGFYALQLQPGSSYAARPTALYVENNLVYGSSFPGGPDWAIGLIYVSTDNHPTVELTNNIFVSTVAGIDYVNRSSSPFGGGHNLWFGAGPAPSSDAAGLSADPRFVDAARGDHHLTPGSPAKGAGVALSHALRDFDGAPRSPSAWSLGPYR